MKKYEIKENTCEVSNKADIIEGVTVSQNWQDPVVVESYATLFEARQALKKYQTSIEEYTDYYLVKEFYIEENTYDEDGEWESGGDIWDFTPMI